MSSSQLPSSASKSENLSRGDAPPNKEKHINDVLAAWAGEQSSSSASSTPSRPKPKKSLTRTFSIRSRKKDDLISARPEGTKKYDTVGPSRDDDADYITAQDLEGSMSPRSREAKKMSKVQSFYFRKKKTKVEEDAPEGNSGFSPRRPQKQEPSPGGAGSASSGGEKSSGGGGGKRLIRQLSEKLAPMSARQPVSTPEVSSGEEKQKGKGKKENREGKKNKKEGRRKDGDDKKTKGKRSRSKLAIDNTPVKDSVVSPQSSRDRASGSGGDELSFGESPRSKVLFGEYTGKDAKGEKNSMDTRTDSAKGEKRSRDDLNGEGVNDLGENASDSATEVEKGKEEDKGKNKKDEELEVDSSPHDENENGSVSVAPTNSDSLLPSSSSTLAQHTTENRLSAILAEEQTEDIPAALSLNDSRDEEIEKGVEPPLSSSQVSGGVEVGDKSAKDKEVDKEDLTENVERGTPVMVTSSTVNSVAVAKSQSENSRAEGESKIPMRTGKRLLVNFNFAARKAGELTIQKGDVVEILIESSSGWWTGRIGSKTGRFPRNYCDDQEIEKALENPVPIIMKVRHTFSARNKGELSMSKGDMITVVEIHNSGWWIGTIGEKKGRFPSNYCEFVDLAESS